MVLAAYKHDFDEMAASMPPAPSRPFTHPILLGMQNPSSAQLVLNKMDGYETSILEWRSNGLSILHQLRRALHEARESGELEAIRYAVDQTIPQIAESIAALQAHLLRPWDVVDEGAEDASLTAGDKRFFKHLQKRIRDFGRSTAGKLDHMRDAFIALSWGYDPQAREVIGTLTTDDEVEGFFAGLASKA